MIPPDLAASLGVSSHLEASANAFARVLVIGPPKIGKTTCVVGTAPQALVLNCDGLSATKGAARHGGEFNVFDVNSRKTWMAGIKAAESLVAAGHVRINVVDTITLLAESIVDDASITLEGQELWGAVKKSLCGGFRKLCSLDAHLIVIAHLMTEMSRSRDGDDEEAGIVPMVPGQSRTLVPAMLDDWVLLDYVPERKPHERLFQLGPQGRWARGGRNIKRTCQVEATVPKLFEELGIVL